MCAPLFGKWSDRIGRKPVLVLSILGTAVGFVVLDGQNPFYNDVVRGAEDEGSVKRQAAAHRRVLVQWLQDNILGR